MHRKTTLCLAIVWASVFCATAGLAQAPASQIIKKKINAGGPDTLIVMSGNPNGSYLYLAYDMSVVLDDSKLRIIPAIGRGGYQNVKDILQQETIDLAITQSNIMTYLMKTGEFGTDVADRLSYITKLYNEEVHILAGRGIETIADLKGKKCNYSDAGSGTQFTMRRIFELLRITCAEVNLDQGDGYLKVKSGELAATILIAGKPAGSFSKFKLEPGMKLLSVPYTTELEADYFQSALTHDDYPNLIPFGKSIETVAVSSVLTVYNWPRDTERYKRIVKFVDAFFTKYDEFLRQPRHPGWQQVNLAAPLKGWKRFPAAQEWLDRTKP